MLEGDPMVEASAHLREGEADQAFSEGLALTVPEAVALAQPPARSQR
jgi:hypothetical protein